MKNLASLDMSLGICPTVILSFFTAAQCLLPYLLNLISSLKMKEYAIAPVLSLNNNICVYFLKFFIHFNVAYEN